MTYGLYAGISARDLGWESDRSVSPCPAGCGGRVYWKRQPGVTGLICSGCHAEFASLNAVAEATAYYLDCYTGDDIQRDEDESGYSDIVATGLTRVAR